MGGLPKEKPHEKAEKIKIDIAPHHCITLPDQLFLFA
jgi:hypothetical protein